MQLRTTIGIAIYNQWRGKGTSAATPQLGLLRRAVPKFECPRLAQSGQSDRARECPLLE